MGLGQPSGFDPTRNPRDTTKRCVSLKVISGSYKYKNLRHFKGLDKKDKREIHPVVEESPIFPNHSNTKKYTREMVFIL